MLLLTTHPDQLDLFRRDPAKGAELGKYRAEAIRRIADAEAEWLAASEALEAAERAA